MALPNLHFSNGSGSDSAASGAGPGDGTTAGSAVTGSAAAHTGGSASTTITLTNSPTLTAVLTDGSHVLWLRTSSTTRRFSKITGKGAGTVTVEDSFTIASGSAVDYAIGGRRQTAAHADSVRLFAADAKPGWTITLDDDQPALAASIACTASGDAATGLIALQGDSVGTRRLLTSATNNVSPLSGGLAAWRLRNLRFTSTAATKTSSQGIDLNATNANGDLWVENCEFGDATDRLQHGIARSASANPNLHVIDCEVHHCLGYGLDNGFGSSGSLFQMVGSAVHDNGGDGLFLQFGGPSAMSVVEDSLFYGNSGDGVRVNSSGSNLARLHVRNCVFHGNSGDGLEIVAAANLIGSLVAGNEFTANGGYGVNYGGSNGDTLKGLFDFNNFGAGATANTSGPVNGLTVGVHSPTVDPAYANAASANFESGTAVRAGGYPDSTRTLGANRSATHSYADIGPQRQEPAGGGGTSVFLVEG